MNPQLINPKNMLEQKNKYRRMLAYLDGCGFMVSLDRVSKRQFTYLVNGTALKTYRTRRSCNRQLLNLYMANVPAESNIVES